MMNSPSQPTSASKPDGWYAAEGDDGWAYRFEGGLPVEVLRASDNKKIPVTKDSPGYGAMISQMKKGDLVFMDDPNAPTGGEMRPGVKKVPTSGWYTRNDPDSPAYRFEGEEPVEVIRGPVAGAVDGTSDQRKGSVEKGSEEYNALKADLAKGSLVFMDDPVTGSPSMAGDDDPILSKSPYRTAMNDAITRLGDDPMSEGMDDEPSSSEDGPSGFRRSAMKSLRGAFKDEKEALRSTAKGAKDYVRESRKSDRKDPMVSKLGS